MPDLKVYTYLLNGNTVTVKLSPEDAKTLGAKEVKPTPKLAAPVTHVAPVAPVKAADVNNAARTAPHNKGR